MRCQGWHADALTRFSEEYQEDLYRKTIAMLRKNPGLAGRDAVDPRRLSAPRAGFCPTYKTAGIAKA